eukprot:6286249-Prymnesium_polylepis.1
MTKGRPQAGYKQAGSREEPHGTGKRTQRPQPSCQRYRVMIESQGTTTLDTGQWQRRRSGFGRPALRSVILKTNAKVCGAGFDPVRTQRHPTHLPLRSPCLASTEDIA